MKRIGGGRASRHRRRPAFWLIALLVTSGVAVAARATLQVTHGLTAEYFANDQRAGAPAARVVTPDISTEQLRDQWRGSPPVVFSARWFGYVTVRRPGLYTFATSSDDGSSLSVDGTLVVDNGGVHGEETRTGRVWLDRGSHFVLLEYAQAGGDYAMRWAWARDGGPLSAVPRWALSPGRVPYWKVTLARALDWLRLSTIWLFVLGCLFVALKYLAAVQIVAGDEREIARAPQGRRPLLDVVSLALFIALAILHTWPLASDPARLSRNDNGDTMLNEWTLAWFAHQAPRDPLHLYDANIFYPERRTLAYSEAMIVQSAMGAPIRWLGAGPVLVYNLVLLAGFVLTGWTMSLVIAKWTGDWIAGLAGAMLLPFLLPYWHLYQEQGLSRSLAEVRMYSASWTDYLMTPGRFHYAWWSHRFARGTALFPGFVGLGLMALAIWPGGTDSYNSA